VSQNKTKKHQSSFINILSQSEMMATGSYTSHISISLKNATLNKKNIVSYKVTTERNGHFNGNSVNPQSIELATVRLPDTTN